MPTEYSPPAATDADFNFSDVGYSPSDANFNFRPLALIYNIIGGTSNVFTAIWADADAGRNNGKFYIASPNALSVIDLESKARVDFYSQNFAGAHGETLDSNDIKDINITRS
jgi:hypothetical protein